MGKKPAAKSSSDAKKKTAAPVEKKKVVTKKVNATHHSETKLDGDHDHTKEGVSAKGAIAHPKAETCKVKSCKRTYRAKGYCVAHYRKWRHGAFGIARYKTCSSTDCRKPMVVNRHGFCEEHFQKFYVKGESASVATTQEKSTATPQSAKAADKTAAAG